MRRRRKFFAVVTRIAGAVVVRLCGLLLSLEVWLFLAGKVVDRLLNSSLLQSLKTNEHLYCLDLHYGRKIWRHPYKKLALKTLISFFQGKNFPWILCDKIWTYFTQPYVHYVYFLKAIMNLNNTTNKFEP